MKKLISLTMALALLCACLLTGCGSTGESGSKDGGETDYSQIAVDTATKTVKIYAEVNGKYFTQVTRHGIVFAEGSNGEKSVLRGLCSEKDFYAALLEIGAVPGDNLNVSDAEGKTVEGDKLDITVSWDGSDGEVPFSDCIKTGSGEPFQTDARFGGNIKAAYDYNTGCIYCLDSCPVGITSSAAYPYGAVEISKTEEFYGNADVLPEDGTLVTVTFTLLAE